MNEYQIDKLVSDLIWSAIGNWDAMMKCDHEGDHEEARRLEFAYKALYSIIEKSEFKEIFYKKFEAHRKDLWANKVSWYYREPVESEISTDDFLESIGFFDDDE